MTPLILHWQQAFEAGVTSCGGKGYHLIVNPRWHDDPGYILDQVRRAR